MPSQKDPRNKKAWTIILVIAGVNGILGGIPLPIIDAVLIQIMLPLMFVLLGIAYKWKFDKTWLHVLNWILYALAIVPGYITEEVLDVSFMAIFPMAINFAVFFSWTLLLGFLFKLALSSSAEEPKKSAHNH